MAYASAATLELHLPGVVAAVDAVSADLIPTALRVTRGRVGNASIWGEEQADAHACLALHWLSSRGYLARANVEDAGEAGVIEKRTTSSAGGGNTYEFASIPVEARDAALASTTWGRAFLEIWHRIRGGIGPMVIR